MDEQFQQWQQQFQKSTPNLDTAALVKQVSRLQKKEKLKAWSEVFFGVLISAYCIFASLFYADSLIAVVLFLALSPIPIGFSVWAFRLKQQQWQQQSVDVNQLLKIKLNQLHTQLHYWYVSVIAYSGLWFALLIVITFNYFMFNGTFVLFTLAGVNALILLATLLRYFYLKQKLSQRITEISLLVSSD
jgi:hypothetical protein